MTRFQKPSRFLARGLVALLLVAAVTACDSNPAATLDELTAAERSTLAATLSTELDLSTAQAEQINSLLAGTDKPEPGRLWTLAAELQQTLTDEQKAVLFEKVEQHRARMQENRQQRFQQGDQRRGQRFNRNAQRPGMRRPQGMRGVSSDLLTPEQQEQVTALREAHREQMQTLIEARQDGSLAPEAFREQAQALREQMRDAMQNLLTDEQKATLEQRRQERQTTATERRDAVAAARAEALGLNGEQEAALEALNEKHRAERQALREQRRADNLDRDGIRAATQALRDAHKAALAEILTEEQLEIVELHAALQSGIAAARRGSFRGRQGIDGPRGFGRPNR